MKQCLGRGFLALEKRTRGNRLRKLGGKTIRLFSPGFGSWGWYLDRFENLSKVNVFGRPMYLDLRDLGFARPLYVHGVHEPVETEFLAKTLRPGMTFVDIGAHVGYYTLLGAEAVGKEGKVIAFEPEPYNLEILGKNVAMNDLTNVVVEDKAISDRSGPAEIFLSKVNYGDHRTFRGRGTTEESRPIVAIEATTLDEYVHRYELSVDVIKMDIQGAEPAALHGMRRTLAENENIILVMEFQPSGLRAFGVKPEDFLRQLWQTGLNIYEFTSSSGVEGTTIERLWEQVKEMSGDEHINLVLSRQELSSRAKIGNINLFERRIYSQNGEDGIIEVIFGAIGTTNKYFVELGVENGRECNTRHLLEEQGWHGLMIDCIDNNHPLIKKEFITAENINDILMKYDVPERFDLLSIDLDYNDYWIWKAIKNYVPRVVVIEYNATHGPSESRVAEYEPYHRWDGTNYFGASLLALDRLAHLKGYVLVGCDSKGVNAFFVRNDLVEDHFEIRAVEELYKPPQYGKSVNGVHVGHHPSDRTMTTI